MGVGDGPLVVKGMTSGVADATTVVVAVGVGVILPGTGIITQATQPMQ